MKDDVMQRFEKKFPGWSIYHANGDTYTATGDLLLKQGMVTIVLTSNSVCAYKRNDPVSGKQDHSCEPSVLFDVEHWSELPPFLAPELKNILKEIQAFLLDWA